jgi:hypothetical protein
VNDEPDCVLYEMKVDKDSITVKFCGIMRHGDGTDFEDCPETQKS